MTDHPCSLLAPPPCSETRFPHVPSRTRDVFAHLSPSQRGSLACRVLLCLFATVLFTSSLHSVLLCCAHSRFLSPPIQMFLLKDFVSFVHSCVPSSPNAWDGLSELKTFRRKKLQIIPRPEECCHEQSRWPVLGLECAFNKYWLIMIIMSNSQDCGEHQTR